MSLIRILFFFGGLSFCRWGSMPSPGMGPGHLFGLGWLGWKGYESFTWAFRRQNSVEVGYLTVQAGFRMNDIDSLS